MIVLMGMGFSSSRYLNWLAKYPILKQTGKSIIYSSPLIGTPMLLRRKCELMRRSKVTTF